MGGFAATGAGAGTIRGVSTLGAGTSIFLGGSTLGLGATIWAGGLGCSGTEGFIGLGLSTFRTGLTGAFFTACLADGLSALAFTGAFFLGAAFFWPAGFAPVFAAAFFLRISFFLLDRKSV